MDTQLLNNRYNAFGPWITRLAGCKVQKISVNAGFTCPNRDGTLGWGGCTYCNNQTFNPEYCDTGKSVTQQLEEGKQFFARKYPDMKYLAYFQAYTNTYAGIDVLKKRYEEALSVDGVVGIIIGTRPDCMKPQLLDYIEQLSRRAIIIVEYGIESSFDDVLLHINRGHDFQCVRQAVEKTAERNITVGGHIIIGLPATYDKHDYIKTEAQAMSQLPLSTIKLHQLQLVKGTSMAQEFAEHPERFHRYTVDEYVDAVIEFMEYSRPDIVFERFVSQSPPELLAVPGWGLKNYEFTALVNKRMAEKGAFQARLWNSTVKNNSPNS